MEPLLLLIEGWWWVAPAAAGAGVATYTGLTTKSRRARRLELDAARREESAAYRALLQARANTGVARANAAAVRSKVRAPVWDAVVPATHETQVARQHVDVAKRAEKAASAQLHATRTQVRAADLQYRSSSRKDPLPIDKLWAQHDAINARWVAYETDPALAIDFPQMGDPRHPATLAFLRAQREALHRRPPATVRDRVDPARFAEYRAAVQTLDAALIEAEHQAGVPGPEAAQPPLNPWESVLESVWQATGWRPPAARR